MNCHKVILPEGAKLKLVRSSLTKHDPIKWIRVNNLPDYAYFNHSIHINAGVGCSSCHGDVSEMNVIMQTEPLSMGWCLECHREPGMYLRPQSEITNTKWEAPPNQIEFAQKLIKEKNIKPPEDCSGCHR